MKGAGFAMALPGVAGAVARLQGGAVLGFEDVPSAGVGDVAVHLVVVVVAESALSVAARVGTGGEGGAGWGVPTVS